MTRMWLGVQPSELCDQHLLGEHAEIHKEIATFLKHDHGEAILRGHVEKGQVILAEVNDRHDALADELERRGMNHGSPFEFDTMLAPLDLINTDNHEPEHNRDDLAERCDECAKRMGAVA